MDEEREPAAEAAASIAGSLCVTIQRMRLCDEPTRDDGRRVARFNCLIGPFRLNGCTIVRTPDGYLLVVLPRWSRTRCILIEDKALFRSVIDGALDLYHTLTAPAEAAEPEPIQWLK